MSNNAYFYSIDFPNIFNGSTVKIKNDYDAIKSDLKLLLGAEKGGLYGDPNFGTALKQIIYMQADKSVVKELIKDEIFESIYSYMPQISIDRDDIDVEIVNNVVSASISVKSDSSIESDLLQIDLLTVDK